MVDLQLPALLFRVERGLIALLLAVLAWLVLQLLARTLFRRQPWRELVQRSSLSVCSTVLVLGLTSWLVGLIPPTGQLSILSVDSLHSFVLTGGAAWTVRRWRRCFRQRRALFTDQLPASLASREKLFLADIIDKVLGTSVFVLWVLVVLGIAGVPITVLATAGGLGAAAVAFGAQSVVSNSLTGVSLYLNRPFVVGDFIEIPSQSLQGHVEKVGWFYTQLRTLDRQPVFIPNAIFAAQSVMNITQVDHRRLTIDFSVTYNDRERVEPICRDLTDALHGVVDVNPDQELWVLFTGYGDSSLDCQLVCHSQSGQRIDALHLQHNLLLLIGEVVKAHGASMPFPTRTLISGTG
ncbi:MAG: mechanosensitive ion channel domain-containing protein [Synechococcus sp.]